MSEPKPVKAGQMQIPPPEEETPQEPVTNATEIAAYRLASAYKRSCILRSVQVDERDEFISNTAGKLRPVHWELARWCINNHIDNLEGFITAQFAYSVPRSSGDLTMGQAPNIAAYHRGSWAYDRWLTYSTRIHKDLCQELESASLEFECGCAEARTVFPHYNDQQLWNFVLMNNFLSLPPLFRYAVAAAEQLERPRKAYREAALQQFLTDPMSYTAAWGTTIPEELRQQAESLILTPLEVKD